MTLNNYKLIRYFIACFLLSSPLFSQVIELPIDTYRFTDFDKTNNPQLEKELRTALDKNPEWKELIRSKRMCIGVVDISRPDMPSSALINGNHMMYAASLPKIAILLAVMDAIDKGDLEMTPEMDETMHKMISVSSNTCSTALIDMVGYKKIASVLKRYQLYDENRYGGLWVGKRYAAGGERFPEPIKGLSHAATVRQVLRYYYLLAYGRLINCDRSEQMLEYLHDPKINHKFVKSLDTIAPHADLYRKSGTWKDYHADSVLVVGNEWRSYILVCLIESPDGESHMRKLVVEVDNILHKMNYLNKP